MFINCQCLGPGAISRKDTRILWVHYLSACLVLLSPKATFLIFTTQTHPNMFEIHSGMDELTNSKPVGGVEKPLEKMLVKVFVYGSHVTKTTKQTDFLTNFNIPLKGLYKSNVTKTYQNHQTTLFFDKTCLGASHHGLN